MKIEPTLSQDGTTQRDTVALRPPPVPTVVESAPSSRATTDTTTTLPEAGISMRRLIGNVDIRHLSPRQMSETSLDLYVGGILPWEEYAMLAFQAELHPDYNKTIGALTGQPADPDRPRDFLKDWEERLTFEEKYNADNPKMVERTRRIVNVFRQIDAPTNVMI